MLLRVRLQVMQSLQNLAKVFDDNGSEGSATLQQSALQLSARYNGPVRQAASRGSTTAGRTVTT